MDTNRQHAIVIGGSMSGMLAARVLSDHFERVTIIDRDTMPETAEHRNGTPQARHLHVLLAKGLQIIEDLFPNIQTEMTALGATTQHWGNETITYLERGVVTGTESAVRTRGISRTLLEWCVRERIKANTGIKLLERTLVKRLLTTDNNQQVIGVETTEKGSSSPQSTELEANLVVDVSGRTSQAPEWLSTLGYGQVDETVINSFLGYATRWYKRPEALPKSTKMITILSSPPDIPRGGVMMEVENGECIVTLAGVNRNYPPTDETGFLEFAHTLLSPAIYALIKDAKPLSNIYGYQRTENRWRHYEKFARWPEGFMVLGDAACAFNPIYGQGMTTGALEALALSEILRTYAGQNNIGMAKAFQNRLATVIKTPWLMATGEDLRYPGTEGGNIKWQDRVVQKYIEQFMRAMPLYPEIGDNFAQVMHMLKPPSTLFQPAIFVKVIQSLFMQQKAAEMPTDLPRTNTNIPTPLG